MGRSKLVYLTNRPSPYQVKFCYKLNKYYDAEFWFYDGVERKRPAFWKVPLGDKCKIIPKVWFKNSSRYFTLTHLNWLNNYNPDILLLGGLSSPANYLAYTWAKRNGKKCVLFTEKSRTKEGVLRKKNFYWKVLTYLYRNIDLIMVASADAVPQFKEEFGFGNKVVQSQYPVDIDDLFSHPLRTQKENYNLIFANRLISTYNPIGAIRIFSKLIAKHPNVHLFMNAHGELRKECEDSIKRLNLSSKITFLDNISNWEDLSEIYQMCDIYFFPAKYSNGNMSMVESMASGMGIIISDRVTGSGEYIQDGLNGFKVPLEEDAFLEALENYIQNPDLFKRHALRNREIVRPRKMDETAKRYFDHLNSLTD